MKLAQLAIDKRFPLEWQMSRPERFMMTAIVEQIRPELSLEIGTYRGGSLQVLSFFSRHVISVDVRPEVPVELAGRFDNVSFRTGDSRAVLPAVVQELKKDRLTPDFVLIDGAHDAPGVRSDIETVLNIDIAKGGRCSPPR